MRRVLLLLAGFVVYAGYAQELYPFTEPASNMPARSASLKLTSMFSKQTHTGRGMQRHMPEVMLGLSKNLMIHGSATFANMHGNVFGWESLRLYGKYRFFSRDQVHQHFRMAAYGAVAYSANDLDRNEINLMGDQSGAGAGLIGTALWNRFALSATTGWNEVIHPKRRLKSAASDYAFSAFTYSLSGGYLLLPREYTDYNQTNVNLYAELLGSRNSWRRQGERYYIDLAPSVQFIFKSTSKLNLGYRFELGSDIDRLSRGYVMASYEHIFLNALKKKQPASKAL
jgi:hypothetical protein